MHHETLAVIVGHRREGETEIDLDPRPPNRIAALGALRRGLAHARNHTLRRRPGAPDLASSVFAMARERGGRAVAWLLAEVAQPDELGALLAFAPEHVMATTQWFQDLVILPLATRALFGEKLNQLRAEIEPYGTRSVTLFLGACRHIDVT